MVLGIRSSWECVLPIPWGMLLTPFYFCPLHRCQFLRILIGHICWLHPLFFVLFYFWIKILYMFVLLINLLGLRYFIVNISVIQRRKSKWFSCILQFLYNWVSCNIQVCEVQQHALPYSKQLKDSWNFQQQCLMCHLLVGFSC